MSQTEVDPHIERVFEALNDHDADGAAEEFAAGGMYYEVPWNREFSRDEFREYFADEMFETFPDYRVEVMKPFTTHNWATTMKWLFSGTQKRAMRGFEPTGKTVSLLVVSVVTISDDGISSWRNFFNMDALDEQLGR